MNILNKMIPNRKVRIRIIRDDFSSPVLGNVWIGREVTLNIATAQRFVDLGYAEFIDGEKTMKLEDAIKKMNLEDAIESLNPDDDAHWTKAGLPDLNVLKELTGEEIKRKDVDQVAPNYTRETATELAKKE